MGVTLEDPVQKEGMRMFGMDVDVAMAPETDLFDKTVQYLVSQVPEEHRGFVERRIRLQDQEKISILGNAIRNNNDLARDGFLNLVKKWHEEDLVNVQTQAEQAAHDPAHELSGLATIEDIVERDLPIISDGDLKRVGYGNTKLIGSGERIEPTQLLQTGHRIFRVKTLDGVLDARPYEGKKRKQVNDIHPLRPFMHNVDDLMPLVMDFLEGRTAKSYSLVRELFYSVYDSLNESANWDTSKNGNGEMSVLRARVSEGAFKIKLRDWDNLFITVDKEFGSNVDESSGEFKERHAAKYMNIKDSLFEMAVQYVVQSKKNGVGFRDRKDLATEQSNLFAALVPRNEPLLRPLRFKTSIKPYGADVGYAVINRRLVVDKRLNKFAATEDVSRGALAYWVFQDETRRTKAISKYQSAEDIFSHLAKAPMQELYEDALFGAYFDKDGRRKPVQIMNQVADYTRIVRVINTFRPSSRKVLDKFAKVVKALGLVPSHVDNRDALVEFERSRASGTLKSLLTGVALKMLENNYRSNPVDVALSQYDTLRAKPGDPYSAIEKDVGIRGGSGPVEK
jgi:hypothetical protein